MRRVLTAAMMITAMGAAACEDSPTEPNNNTVVFTANLAGSSEVPPVTGPEAGGTGTATMTFNVTRDSAGAITAATANITANIANLPANTPLILAHIHTGAAGSTGGVLVNTGLSAATAVNVGANGTATLSFSNLTVNVDQLNSIIANPAGFYFNVHSTLNPGGVVRGQLVRQNN